LSYPDTIDVDVHDDLNREVALYVGCQSSSLEPCSDNPRYSYKQALHSAQEARCLASKHHLPFTRPPDYFAEMVKTDAHMERIRMRLLDESSGIKKSEEKKKEREGKKFGKQVQIEKIKERERSKKEMGEKLKGLKRSRFFTKKMSI
jgi:rRNA-processing protein EBP2